MRILRIRIPNTVASWCKLTDRDETWTPGDVDFLEVPVDLQHAGLQNEPLVLASIQTQSLKHIEHVTMWLNFLTQLFQNI
jgi:hypothetical protein